MREQKNDSKKERTRWQDATILAGGMILLAALIFIVTYGIGKVSLPSNVRFILFCVCLFVGAAAVAFILMRSVAYGPDGERFAFRTLRGAFLYGTVLAGLFSCSLIFRSWERTTLILLFFLAGLAGGLLCGIGTVDQMKRQIIGDRVIVPKRRHPIELRTYWKVYLIVSIFWIGSSLASLHIFDSREAWVASWAGVFAGYMLDLLLWVLLYERRNNARLKFQYSDTEHAQVTLGMCE